MESVALCCMLLRLPAHWSGCIQLGATDHWPSSEKAEKNLKVRSWGESPWMVTPAAGSLPSECPCILSHASRGVGFCFCFLFEEIFVKRPRNSSYSSSLPPTRYIIIFYVLSFYITLLLYCPAVGQSVRVYISHFEWGLEKLPINA